MDDDAGAAPLVLVVAGAGEADRGLAAALAAAGYETSRVPSADACLEHLGEGGGDAVVTGERLPDRDGVSLVESVGLAHPDVPVVVAPAAGSESLAARALDAGAAAYVPADEQPAAVVERVEATIEAAGGTASDEGERRYRHLVETSPAPINLFDASGTTIWGNDAVLDLLGLPDRDALVGRSIFEFIHAEDHDIAVEEIRAVVEEKRSTGPTPMRLERADGEIREIRVSTAPGRFRGRDIGQAVVLDVTDLRSARERLETARRFVEDSLDALVDVFVVLDERGDLVRWNSAALSVTGYDEVTFEDLGLSDLVVEEHVERALASVARTVEEGSDEVALDVLTSDGRVVPFEFRCRRLTDADGALQGVVSIGRDVSERRERERQLQAFEQMLRHNLRTELNVILGVADEIAAGTAADVPEAARLIRERGGRLYAEADKFKDLVAMLTTPEEPGRIDVTTVVENRVAAARERYPAATVELDAQPDVAARAVPQLGDAVGELIENAVEHNDEDAPWVRVSVVRDDGSVTLTVADAGPGIPEVERATLTGDREITQLQHGSGVGLWLVHWMVQRSGGQVDFFDGEAGGSEVRVVLDAAEGR